MTPSVLLAEIDLTKCGKDSPLYALAKNGRVRAKARDLEHQEQRRLIEWRDESIRIYPELVMLVAVPNGGMRSKRTAGRLKAEGVSPGYPDLLLDLARGGFHGWRGELKAEGGRVTDTQKQWHKALIAQGYHVDVAFGWLAMRDCLLRYLTGQ